MGQRDIAMAKLVLDDKERETLERWARHPIGTTQHSILDPGVTA